jgi:monoamine oxidase
MDEPNNFDVIVIGAGAAGLTAGVELGKSGLSVLIVESRERIGGRILTINHPGSGSPIELGAEFIHGLVPQVWSRLLEERAEILEMDGTAWCSDGHLLPCDFTGDVDRVLEQMDVDAPDQSFSDFLRSSCGSNSPADERAKKRALNYVVGFNAADPAQVGVHWLARGMREEEEAMGDRAFRSKNGYADLLRNFQSGLTRSRVVVKTSVPVTHITWAPGKVAVSTQGIGGRTDYRSKKVVVTVPLSILKLRSREEGAIQFEPPLPEQKVHALQKLEMGKVIRLVLRFQKRFWDSVTPPDTPGQTLSNMSFLLTEDEWFPTWWTTMPLREPQITGWAPFQCAERLAGKDSDFVMQCGLQALSRILPVRVAELKDLFDGAYFHDWQSDPFSRGAYSYGKVGADGAQETLAKPLAETVYFAGEATATPGSNGTVHGAIASGQRASNEILGSYS